MRINDALTIFVPVAVPLLTEPWRWDDVWAAVCIVAAVFFVFRGQSSASSSLTPQVAPAAISVDDKSNDADRR